MICHSEVTPALRSFRAGRRIGPVEIEGLAMLVAESVKVLADFYNSLRILIFSCLEETKECFAEC
ncbi:MAG: hypothetical protein AMJ65_16700 [Phycisphaerae bacterium SG8_4]|nr:MAG: hypothetical protein AMJ65_16700 [Phycisphaerae bacterium SG8_4]